MITLLQSLAASVPGGLLFAGACVGHAFFLVVALNLIYGLPLHHRILDNLRKVDIALVLLGPLLFALLFGYVGSAGLSWAAGTNPGFLHLYLAFCAILGLIVAPIAQLCYWLRRTAPQVAKRTSEIVDVPKTLGYVPYGSGKHQRWAHMPGNSAFEVEFVELDLRLPQLPHALDGLTILHITDQHFLGSPDRAFHRFVLDHAMKQGEPDLVCVTGDIVDSPWHHRWMLPLLGRLKWKVAGLAILGNHDKKFNVPQIRRRLDRLGFQVLANSWRALNVNGEPLVVVGNESPWFRPAPKLENCPKEPFRLCLSHTPDNIAWARRQRIDLMLAGHVHGGHIRLPLIGSILVPSRYSRRYDCGTFFASPTVLHVSRGLAGQHPFRLCCRPEVTRLVLHRT